MSATISELIRNHLSETRSDGNDYINSMISKYRRRMDESVVKTREPMTDDEIFSLIRKKKYGKAAELAKIRKLNPFSLFNGVSLFGKVYDGIPFVAAALATAAEKKSKDETVGQRISNVLNEVFKDCGTNSANMFDAKFSTPSGCDDILTFVLTKDGTVKPSKEYDGGLDTDALVLLHSILNGGYTLSNSSKFLKYVLANDLISTLRFMIDNGIYAPSMDSLTTYGISPKSNVGRLISVIAEHPFALHSPEIEYDDKGKFAGGSLYDTMKRVGYDISDLETEQDMHPSVMWMLKDAILNAYVNYRNNGENFSNVTDICFPDGSEFMSNVEKMLTLCSEYRKFMKGCESETYSQTDKERFLRELVKNANGCMGGIQNGLNGVLEKLSLPKVHLVLKNPLEEGDKDILYKAVNFMKEIWNSMKCGRKRTTTT